MKRALPLFLLMGLAACSGSGQWSKSGVSPETARADLDACESEARTATRRDQNIDADIMATRSQDWQRSGTLGLKRDTLNMQNQNRTGDMVGICMRAKGYSSPDEP
ncbi:MAG TPA: hypothetical protein VMG55_02475 [Stellaceae bacterium]|nr:hypothetical protein [Stellaceae bacterium]